jgi:glucosyl-3-phosphoglycerate synthase
VTPEAWLFRNSYLPSRDAPQRLRSAASRIGLCLLSRNATTTLGRHLLLLQHGWPGGHSPWSEILVADLGSTDATHEIARQYGGTFLEPVEPLAASLDPSADGDGLYRALARTESEILLVVPADLVRLDLTAVATMIVTLLDNSQIQLCLGTSEVDGGPLAALGARPILAALCPELAVISDPTAPILALRTSAIRELPLARTAGYESALVVDCAAEHGLQSIAQVRSEPLEWEHQDPRLEQGRSFRTLVALVEALRRRGHLSTTAELGHLLPRPRDWSDDGPRLVTSLEVFPWARPMADSER